MRRTYHVLQVRVGNGRGFMLRSDMQGRDSGECGRNVRVICAPQWIASCTKRAFEGYIACDKDLDFHGHAETRCERLQKPCLWKEQKISRLQRPSCINSFLECKSQFEQQECASFLLVWLHRIQKCNVVELKTDKTLNACFLGIGKRPTISRYEKLVPNESLDGFRVHLGRIQVQRLAGRLIVISLRTTTF